MPYEVHEDKIVMRAGKYNLPKPWVGLTDEEFEQMLTDAKFTRTDLMMIGACVDSIRQMIEDRLKEKNQ